MPSIAQDQETRRLYGELEYRLLARDQIGGSRVYYDLLRHGRPLPEIMVEAVRVHAPYTHVPYHQRIDDGFPNFVNNDHCLLVGARRDQPRNDAAGETGRIAAGADDLVHPLGARHLEPEDTEGAGPLRDPRLQDAEYDAARARRLLARPGAALRDGPIGRAAQQLADPRRARPGHRRLPHLSRSDGRNRASPRGIGAPCVRRVDRCPGPDALQPLLYDRAQGLSGSLGGRNRRRDRLGSTPTT